MANAGKFGFMVTFKLNNPHYNRMNFSARSKRGFTLVELAVVLFIVGLLASAGFAALKTQLANASMNATKKRQDVIKESLISYLAKNKRLPCPWTGPLNDATGGLDSSQRDTTKAPYAGANPSNCKTFIGLVPYAELGLQKSSALDGWENFFTYVVSPQWTATLTTDIGGNASCDAANTANYYNGKNNTCDAFSAFNSGNTGKISVSGRISSSTVLTYPIAISGGAPSGVAALLVSHGINGFGAYTSKGTQNDPALAGADEVFNMPPTNLTAIPAATANPANPFMQREYSEDSAPQGGAYDDVVTMLGVNDLLGPLSRDGSLQSAQGQYAVLSLNLQDWVVSKIGSQGACQLPAGITNPPATNPASAYYYTYPFPVTNITLPQITIPLGYTTDPWGNTLVTLKNGVVIPEANMPKFFYCPGELQYATSQYTCIHNNFANADSFNANSSRPVFTIGNLSEAPSLGQPKKIEPITIQLQSKYTFLTGNGCL
jgi:prepilin-type N-terminal cleavage/methylation domain-containing protein